MFSKPPASVEADIRKDLVDAFSAQLKSDASAVLVGGSGTGKTVLLHLIRHTDRTRPSNRIVDAASPPYRTRLGLATACVAPPAPPSAEKFLQAAASARLEGTHRAISSAIESFAACLKELREVQESILVDNIDAAPDQVIGWFSQILVEHGGPRIIGAAKSDATLPANFIRLKVPPLTKSQTKLLVDYWARALNLNSSGLADFVYRTSQGNAVLAELAIWCAWKSGHSGDWGGVSLGQSIRQALDGEDFATREAWTAVVTAKHRVTLEIVELLAGSAAAASLESRILPLPFMRPLEELMDGFSIHDLARQKIEAELEVSPSTRKSLLGRLCHNVYPQLLSRELDPTVLSRLQLERLRYHVELDLEEGVEKLEDEFNDSVRGGNIARAEEIARVAEDALAAVGFGASARLTLLVAECALTVQNSDRAYDTLQAIAPRRLAMETDEVRARHSLLRARCATSPSPTSKISIFEAVGFLEASLRSSANAPTEIVFEIKFELAEAFQLVARNRDAERHYREIAASQADARLRIRSLEELSSLYRDMQRLDDAMSALQQANTIRLEEQLPPSGTATYYLANITRDTDQFAKAETLYRHAEGQFIDSGDIHQLCCLYGDFAWMKFLSEDNETARYYLKKYNDLADSYNFGRELSEYWHMTYHLLMDENDEEAALHALERALEFANRYGNVYMQLDCLMHRVQACVRSRSLDQASQLLKEMERIEKLGAEINVFRGRALIYFGDGLDAEGSESEALKSWTDGLEIVARFGNSRTNVELLSDLFTARTARLREVEARLGQESWPSAVLVNAVTSLSGLPPA